MRLRDYLAAKAMVAFLETPFFQDEANTKGVSEYADDLADEAYTLADAMLKRRERGDE